MSILLPQAICAKQSANRLHEKRHSEKKTSYVFWVRALGAFL